MALRVAIVDDEKHASETLEWQLRKAATPTLIVGVFNDPRAAIEALPALKPELVFLDIEMPSLNGFQFLEKLGMRHLQVVFTTAYDKFAVKAFRVSAVDYLLKPVDNTELDAALRKATHDQAQIDMGKLKSIFADFNQAHRPAGKLALPSVHGIDFIQPERIIFCQSDSNYTRIYLEGNQKLLVSKTLKEIEHMLPTSQFFRIHNSYLANLERVSKFLRSGGGTLVMEDGAELRVSRQRKDELMERMMLRPDTPAEN